MSGIMRKCDSEKGFTLIELIITAIILGILVGIVVMTMSIARDKAQEATCRSNLKIIHSAIQQYNIDHSGQYPPDLDTLVDERYIKPGFKFTCPAGDLGALSGNYRDNYDPATGIVTCPRSGHNP